jgi:hypothetical protein
MLTSIKKLYAAYLLIYYEDLTRVILGTVWDWGGRLGWKVRWQEWGDYENADYRTL